MRTIRITDPHNVHSPDEDLHIVIPAGVDWNEAAVKIGTGDVVRNLLVTYEGPPAPGVKYLRTVSIHGDNPRVTGKIHAVGFDYLPRVHQAGIEVSCKSGYINRLENYGASQNYGVVCEEMQNTVINSIDSMFAGMDGVKIKSQNEPNTDNYIYEMRTGYSGFNFNHMPHGELKLDDEGNEQYRYGEHADGGENRMNGDGLDIATADNLKLGVVHAFCNRAGGINVKRVSTQVSGNNEIIFAYFQTMCNRGNGFAVNADFNQRRVVAAGFQSL